MGTLPPSSVHLVPGERNDQPCAWQIQRCSPDDLFPQAREPLSGDDRVWADPAQQKVRVEPHPHVGTRQHASLLVGDHAGEAGLGQRPQEEGQARQVRFSPLWERADDMSIPQEGRPACPQDEYFGEVR